MAVTLKRRDTKDFEISDQGTSFLLVTFQGKVYGSVTSVFRNINEAAEQLLDWYKDADRRVKQAYHYSPKTGVNEITSRLKLVIQNERARRNKPREVTVDGVTYVRKDLV